MLAGDLVTLRAVVPDDHDALFALASDLATWESRNDTPPTTLDRGVWESTLADTGRDVRFAIEADGAFVGVCWLLDVDSLARHADVGISLVETARGRGYGTDAMRVLVRFAFRRHNLRRVCLDVIASNAAAIGSYRKAGFVEEGRRREHVWVDGRYEDLVEMGLLRDEWDG